MRTAAGIVIHFQCLKTYDESLDCLRNALDTAKLGGREKLDGFSRLDRFVRAVETELQPEADFDATIAREMAISETLDGRSAFDRRSRQLRFF